MPAAQEWLHAHRAQDTTAGSATLIISPLCKNRAVAVLSSVWGAAGVARPVGTRGEPSEGAHALRHRLWKAPQAIFTTSVAPATLLGDLSTFIEKSPHGSPHVHTCAHHETMCKSGERARCVRVLYVSFQESLRTGSHDRTSPVSVRTQECMPPADTCLIRSPGTHGVGSTTSLQKPK